MGLAKLLVLLLALACADAALAQQTRPSPPDESKAATPRGALHLLNEAMKQGDIAAIKQLFLATTPSERRIVEADAGMAAALAELRKAAVARFGEGGADVVTGDSAAGSAESAARIDSAEITIEGDTATVVYKDEKEAPFVLKKVSGEWKVPVSELGKPLDPGELEQRLSELAAQRKVMQDITRDIEHARFATAEQAHQAWQRRFLQAATSQPTTRPAGG